MIKADGKALKLYPSAFFQTDMVTGRGVNSCLIRKIKKALKKDKKVVDRIAYMWYHSFHQKFYKFNFCFNISFISSSSRTIPYIYFRRGGYGKSTYAFFACEQGERRPR